MSQKCPPQNKKKATLVTEYCRIPVTVTEWFWISQHHILCATNTMQTLQPVLCNLAAGPHTLA